MHPSFLPPSAKQLNPPRIIWCTSSMWKAFLFPIFHYLFEVVNVHVCEWLCSLFPKRESHLLLVEPHNRFCVNVVARISRSTRWIKYSWEWLLYFGLGTKPSLMEPSVTSLRHWPYSSDLILSGWGSYYLTLCGAFADTRILGCRFHLRKAT